jgi:hypothetical protein
MVDQNMQRRPLDGDARSLEPDTQFCKNIVNEALIARVVCQPVHDVAVGIRDDRIDIWRRVHTVLLRSALDRLRRICRVPLDGSTEPAAICVRARVAVGCHVSGGTCPEFNGRFAVVCAKRPSLTRSTQTFDLSEIEAKA